MEDEERRGGKMGGQKKQGGKWEGGKNREEKRCKKRRRAWRQKAGKKKAEMDKGGRKTLAGRKESCEDLSQEGKKGESGKLKGEEEEFLFTLVNKMNFQLKRARLTSAGKYSLESA